MAGRRDLPTGTFNPTGMVSGWRNREILTGEIVVVIAYVFYNSFYARAIQQKYHTFGRTLPVTGFRAREAADTGSSDRLRPSCYYRSYPPTSRRRGNPRRRGQRCERFLVNNPDITWHKVGSFTSCLT